MQKMKFERLRVTNFENAFFGMRNPKESHHLSDSYFGFFLEGEDLDYEIAEKWIATDDTEEHDERLEEKAGWLRKNGVLRFDADRGVGIAAFIGPKDMNLAQRLIVGGSEHRKFLRQINVSFNITAPLYLWKELDQYKIGTVTDSFSTMHKILSKPITIESFEIDDLYESLQWIGDFTNKQFNMDFIIKEFIDALEGLRLAAIEAEELAKTTTDVVEKQTATFMAKKYWKELIRWLPSSWVQTRTWSGNYEVLRSIVHQRKGHKLSEWHTFLEFLKTLPYAEELIFYDGK